MGDISANSLRIAVYIWPQSPQLAHEPLHHETTRGRIGRVRIAPCRPKYNWFRTSLPTDGRTRALIESLRRD